MRVVGTREGFLGELDTQAVVRWSGAHRKLWAGPGGGAGRGDSLEVLTPVIYACFSASPSGPER